MLKTRYDKPTGIFSVLFDPALPVQMKHHAAMSEFWARLEGNPDVEIQRTNGTIAGFSVPLDHWLDRFEEALPTSVLAFQKTIHQKLNDPDWAEQPEALDVNFHQKPFDTPERYWQFILNQGHFIDYFFNRLSWYLGPKNALIAPFPLHVDLEASSACNMRCPMCYNDQLQEIGKMDFSLFQKAVDECAANEVFSVRLSWRGETLSHPRIKDFIAYAAARIKNVSFLTNAFYLDEEISEFLVVRQVSYISVSFDGIGEIYEKIRHPAKFHDSYNRVKRLMEIRNRSGSVLPQIRLCTIWPAIKDNPDAYSQTMKDVCDYMVYNPYINFAGPMTLKDQFICQYPWERIVVAYNGKTQCCTGWNATDIILGNLQQHSIFDMWHGERLNHVRQLHAAGKRMELQSCSHCRHGTTGDPNIDIDAILQRGF
ncbi:MAG: radical SAM/SPASM domain-containing protein [Candidatus Omnitrophota bacterium]|jgi:radical SAM protein with 4Fe4S-binding SPASM domain|nr:MAG: radical SAM/SPASM domain-containing protein [Candidatus Omnitrophota bacterium]